MSGFTIGIGIRRPSIIPSGYSNIFPDTTNNLLLEDGGDLLLEDGANFYLRRTNEWQT